MDFPFTLETTMVIAMTVMILKFIFEILQCFFKADITQYISVDPLYSDEMLIN